MLPGGWPTCFSGDGRARGRSPKRRAGPTKEEFISINGRGCHSHECDKIRPSPGFPPQSGSDVPTPQLFADLTGTPNGRRPDSRGTGVKLLPPGEIHLSGPDACGGALGPEGRDGATFSRSISAQQTRGTGESGGGFRGLLKQADSGQFCNFLGDRRVVFEE